MCFLSFCRRSIFALVLVAVIVTGCGGGGTSGTVATAPGIPQSLAAVGGEGQVDLTWTTPSTDGGSTIIDYMIYRGTTSGSHTFLGNTGSVVASYTDATATNGTKYFYTVTAANSAGESSKSNEVSVRPNFAVGLLLLVSAGTFEMGATDAEAGDPGELPRHNVTLSGYQIGKYQVSNQEYADVLNWALGMGYVIDSVGTAYTGGDVYGGGQALLDIASTDCQISYSQGQFVVGSRDGYQMSDHPVLMVSWYGAVAYCNWVSEANGLTPCYDMTDWKRLDEKVPAQLLSNGFRLPTEAEWERAAAWDSQHWVYGFISDTDNATRSNCHHGAYANPLGLTAFPYTSPVGFYDGVNASTVDSPSPVGCYDMTGNVFEWCHDWFLSYTVDPQTDPTGPATGTERILRGGSWYNPSSSCRTAVRYHNPPTDRDMGFGFRIVGSVAWSR